MSTGPPHPRVAAWSGAVAQAIVVCCSVLRDRGRESPVSRSRRSLKTAPRPRKVNGYSLRARFGERGAHRQDSKGTRWMPWPQEPKKDVDGCDTPRLAAEQALTRGSPNGATRRW